MPEQEHHILKLIKELDLSVSQFERTVGVGASTINKAIERNSKLGFGTVQKISATYPDLNRDWIATGKGKMRLDQKDGDNNYILRDGVGKYETVKAGKKRDSSGAITRDQLIEELNKLSFSSELTLYDEFTLKIIGNTLSNAFLNEKLGPVLQNISEKVKVCRLYAQEYYVQRMEGLG